MTKKRYIVLGAIILLAAAFFLIRDGEEERELVAVEKGTLVKEVFETGSTEKGENVNLGFKEGGRVETIYVREGEEVSRGEVVAELDKRDLRSSLSEARAGLEAAEADYEKLLEGATEEDLRVARSAVSSAERELDSAKASFRDTEKVVNEALREAHRNTQTFLGDVFMEAKDVKDDVVDIANKYFSSFVVSETVSGRRSRDVIRRSVREIEEYRDLVQRNVGFDEKKGALEDTERQLKVIIRELDNLIDISESDFYEDRFSPDSKRLLKELRGGMNTYLSETSALVGKIASVEAETDSKMSSARAAVTSAESALERAQAELDKVKAEAGETDRKAARAAIEQARARVSLAQNRLEDATLKSPLSGTVASLGARRGEIVSGGTPIAVITPDEEIQIAVDVYEGDIREVDVGDAVTVSFVAFPGEEFEGEVVSINKTGKVIDGVVYYEVKVMLDEYPENTLPQMTVDVTINAEEKEDVPFLPDRAIRRREGRHYVNVLEEGEVKEREIETGITGEGRRVEIISGLKEGEKVVID